MTNYPFVKFHFQVDWGGTKIGFSEVTGLKVETEVVEYSDGASLEHSSIKMPGRVKYENITLKRGTFKSNNEFFQWWNATKLNKPDRKTVTINLLDEAHQPVVTWEIKNAWPVSVESTDLKAEGSEVAIETLVLAHEGLTIRSN